MRFLVICVLLVGSFARADRAAKAPSLVARVVGIEISNDDVILTVAAGSEVGLTRRMHARVREGKTTKPLTGGEAVIIRIDRRSSILKVKLSPEQVRANRFVQFDP